MLRAWYGCRPDTPDHNDYTMALGGPTSIPESVDLRHWMPPVMNQGPLGSCTAHGVIAAARYYIIKHNLTYDFEMSRLQLYWDSRYLEGTQKSDAGAEIRDVIKTLNKTGVGHEELWPYDPMKWDVQPAQEVYDDAVQYKAQIYQRVPVRAVSLKQTLAAGHPVIIGISVYESFEGLAAEQTGVVSMPRHGEPLVGGHCMVVVGYNQMNGYFTVQNSWGTDWGDKGFCYIPEAYLGTSDYGSDYWTLAMVGTDYELKAAA